jgi:hypothetical protein
MAKVLEAPDDSSNLARVRAEVEAFAAAFPLYPEAAEPAFC